MIQLSVDVVQCHAQDTRDTKARFLDFQIKARLKQKITQKERFALIQPVQVFYASHLNHALQVFLLAYLLKAILLWSGSTLKYTYLDERGA